MIAKNRIPSKKKSMKNSVKNMVLETMEGLYKTGTISAETLKEVRGLAQSQAKPSQAKPSQALNP